MRPKYKRICRDWTFKWCLKASLCTKVFRKQCFKCYKQDFSFEKGKLPLENTFTFIFFLEIVKNQPKSDSFDKIPSGRAERWDFQTKKLYFNHQTDLLKKNPSKKVLANLK